MEKIYTPSSNTLDSVVITFQEEGIYENKEQN
jgi:hypothetical protein